MFSIVRRFWVFITISVRFKGENWGRSVELKQIPGCYCQDFVLLNFVIVKIKLILLVGSILFSNLTVCTSLALI